MYDVLTGLLPNPPAFAEVLTGEGAKCFPSPVADSGNGGG